MSDWNTFINAFQRASEYQKQLIDSGYLATLFIESGLDEAKRQQFLDLTGDAVLEINKLEEVQQRLQSELELEPGKAEALTQKIDQVMRTSSTIENKASTELTGGSSGSTEEASMPVEPADLTTVTPLRTMTSDIEKIHGYGAHPAATGEPAEDEEPVYRSSQDDSLGQA